MPTNTSYQRTAMAAAVAACFPGIAFGAPVARVDFASGSVNAVAPNGQTRALSRGSEIEVGETVSTQQGRAQLRFVDGAYMSLQPQTEFKVEEFRYSGKEDAGDGIVMNLLKGGLRTITGLIGRTNRNAYRLKTDVATIGIRGTEYSVKYTNSIEVFVTDGAIAVENQSGSFTVPGGTGVLISNDQTPPQQTDQKPVLPPETPVYEQQQQVTQQVPPPPNPFVQQQTILTGTIVGNWTVVSPMIEYFQTEQDQTIVLDAQGVLTSVSDSFEGSIFTSTAGTSTAISSGNDGVIAWGRWINGITGGDGPITGVDTDEAFSQGLHYVVGIAATMPTSGTATYSMIGATPPSIFEGSATVNSSMLKVDFGGGSSSFHAAWTINGNSVITPTAGIPLTVSGKTLFGSGSWPVSSFSAFPSHFVQFDGIFAGAAAARAGVVYVVNSGHDGATAHGAIAYSKSGP